ncbi:MAG: hypothetical protein R2873_17695 [Caldilineaceae bacterium]
MDRQSQSARHRLADDDDETWRKHQDTPPKDLLVRFWEIRRQELALIEELQHADWNECRETGWGHKPLSWVVTKTYQHTLNTATRCCMALWWEHPGADRSSADENGFVKMTRSSALSTPNS